VDDRLPPELFERGNVGLGLLAKACAKLLGGREALAEAGV
jgi:hypothetical protein